MRIIIVVLLILMGLGVAWTWVAPSRSILSYTLYYDWKDRPFHGNSRSRVWGIDVIKYVDASYAGPSYVSLTLRTRGEVALTIIWCILAGWVLLSWFIRRRPRHSLLCCVCDYDLRGSPSGVCPECGTQQRRK